MSDQEYVRGAWEECEHRDTALAVLAGPHYIVIGNRRRAGWRSFFAHSEAEAWAAAAEFTRERLEQVRQLEREKETVEDNRDFERLQLEMLPFWSDDDPMPVEADFDTQADCVVFWVRRIFANVRVLARLESALADLKRDMK